MREFSFEVLKASQRSYLFFHLLSLDVVLGAVGGYAFACRVLKQEISPAFSVIIGLAVWITYLTDHLLDSLNAGSLQVFKYELFSRNRRSFLMFLAFLCLAELLLVLTFIEHRFILVGFLTGSGVLIYLMVQHFLKSRIRQFFPKEMLISVIYTAALWSFPLMQATNYPGSLYWFFAVHFLLVVSNVLLFSFFEQYEDIGRGRISVFTGLSSRVLRNIIWIICALALVTGALTMALSGEIVLTMPLIFISSGYLSVMVLYRRQGIASRYAQITDGAFMLFLVYLL